MDDSCIIKSGVVIVRIKQCSTGREGDFKNAALRVDIFDLSWNALRWLSGTVFARLSTRNTAKYGLIWEHGY